MKAEMPWGRAVTAAASVSLAVLLLAVGFGGWQPLDAGRDRPDPGVEANEEIARLTAELADVKGQLAVTELKLDRLSAVAQYSAAYRIPANLAGRIYDAALAEDLHPSLGFQLVKVESGFRSQARSPRGALGYTQVRLPTAREVDPTVTERDLLDPDTNLRIGFRILRRLLRQFDHDLELALRAYNLGPTGAVMSLLDSTADARAASYTGTVMKGVRRATAKRSD
jgi:soluble lytic murein transglycosylase-like protein